MAKKDTDLFDRLRQAGLRKQAATALSAVSEGAGKKTQQTARAAVKELRSVADEIERRLPASDGDTPRRSPARRTRRSTPRSARSSSAGRSSTAAAKSKPRSARTSAAGRSSTAAAKSKPRSSTRRASAGTRSRASSS